MLTEESVAEFDVPLELQAVSVSARHAHTIAAAMPVRRALEVVASMV